MPSPVPDPRIRALNTRPLDPRGEFVLYWRIAARRTRFNFALQRAVALLDGRASLSSLPIDHTTRPVGIAGGEAAARRRLSAFVERDLAKYETGHNHPDAESTSRLSPYLHFGHIAPHEIFSAVFPERPQQTPWPPEPRTSEPASRDSPASPHP